MNLKNNCYKCYGKIEGRRFSSRVGDMCSYCTFPTIYQRPKTTKTSEFVSEQPKSRWEKEKQELWTKTVMERRRKQEEDKQKEKAETEYKNKENAPIIQGVFSNSKSRASEAGTKDSQSEPKNNNNKQNSSN